MSKCYLRTCCTILAFIWLCTAAGFAQGDLEDALGEKLRGIGEVASIKALVEEWLEPSEASTPVLLSVGTATSYDIEDLVGVDGVRRQRLNLSSNIFRITLYGSSSSYTQGILNSEWSARDAFVLNYRVMNNDTLTLLNCERLSQEKAPLGSWRTTDTNSCDKDAQKIFERITDLL